MKYLFKILIIFCLFRNFLLNLHFLENERFNNVKLNNCKRMTIGVVANPNPSEGNDYNQAKIDLNYVIWLEKSEGIVIPIVPFMKDEELYLTLSKVNGVLLQGGGRYIKPFDHFENFTLKILNYIIKQNETEDDKVSCWATCQGFELTFLLFSKSKFRDNDNLFGRSKGTYETFLKTIEYKNENLNFEWKIKKHLNQNLFKYFTQNRVNAQFHSTYVKFSSFEFYENLNDLFEITSYQYDDKGVKFIDSFQGRNNLNIFGTQFHPEKALNEKVFKQIYFDDYEVATELSLGISDFFVNMASRKSKYCYENDLNPLKDVRDNFNFMSCGSVDYYYYFNNTDSDYTNNKGNKPLC